MCGGVLRGFVGVKLSGSASLYGKIKIIKVNDNRIVISLRKSLNEKYGWNGILRFFLLRPNGLFDPVS